MTWPNQGVPPGSYLRTCTHVATYGDRLIADCRRTDGSWGRTALRDVGRCTGDIGNMGGQLACNGGKRDYGWRDRDYRQSPGYGSIAMTATADLATILRAGIGHRRGIGPQPAIPRIMADN
jgi:hypothetical protein